MSRYLSQLARETRSRLKPPSTFGLAPRAAAFAEIHEERLVPATPDTPRPELRPATPPPAEAVEAAPPAVAPQRRLSPDPSPLPTQPIERVAAPPTPPRARDAAPPPLEAPEQRTPRAASFTPEQIVEREIYTSEYLVEDGLAEIAAPAVFPASAPAVHQRSAPGAPPRSAPAPAREATRPAAPSPAPPQPSLDVTIGKIEVTIEGERKPPLRITRPAPPRVPSKRGDPPRRAGRLARLYLDR